MSNTACEGADALHALGAEQLPDPSPSYISFDSNDPVVATLEGSTLASGLSDIQVGGDDSAFSAVERLFITANGPMGKDDSQRQGPNSAIIYENGPLNVLGGVLTIILDYSPL